MRPLVVATTVVLLTAVAALAAPPGPQSGERLDPALLRITSPVGGEKWYHGSYHAITWKAGAAVAGTVELVLLRNGAPLGVIARGIPAAKGSYGWFASNYEGGVGPSGDGYQVAVRVERRRFGRPVLSSTSPGAFGLYLLVVASPNGNEGWALGTSHQVAWNAQNMLGTVDVTLWRDTAYVAHIARNVPVGDGAAPWNVGAVLPGPPPPGPVVPGPGYKVCVKSTDARYQGFDCSDVDFRVVKEKMRALP